MAKKLLTKRIVRKKSFFVRKPAILPTSEGEIRGMRQGFQE